MRKTTVDQLAATADISKGAFNKFYESKELLCFELLENLHRETYQAAAKALRESTSASPAERAAFAALAACDYLDKSGMMGFMERGNVLMLKSLKHSGRMHASITYF